MLLMLLLGCLLSPSGSEITKEYCHVEDFNVTCGRGHVVMVTSAFYGRMRIGKCVPYDYEVGCSSDVLEEMESRCSGRGSCFFGVSEVFKVRPCRIDLVSYLEASYVCEPVVQLVLKKQTQQQESYSSIQLTTTENKCLDDNSAEEIRTKSGYLSSSVALRTGYGTEPCPWRIRASLGQKIKVVLLDFSNTNHHQLEPTYKTTFRSKHSSNERHNPAYNIENNNNHYYLPSLGKASSSSSSSSSSTSGKQHCWVVATLQELALKEVANWKGSRSSQERFEWTSCWMGGLKRKKKFVFTSQSNLLSIHLSTNLTSVTQGRTSRLTQSVPENLLFYFEVIGCVEPELVGNVILMRREDLLGVYCNSTGERWHLVCKNDTWVGTYSNCSQVVHYQQSQNEEYFMQRRKMSLGLLVAVSVGVLVGIVSGFVLLVMIFTCRRKIRHRRAEQSVLLVDYDNKTNSYKVLDRSNVNIPLDPTSYCSCGFQAKYSASSPDYRAMQFQDVTRHSRQFGSLQMHLSNTAQGEDMNWYSKDLINNRENVRQLVRRPCDVIPQEDKFIGQCSSQRDSYHVNTTTQTGNSDSNAPNTFPLTCALCFPAALPKRATKKLISQLNCTNSGTPQGTRATADQPPSKPLERWVVLPCGIDDSSIVATTSISTENSPTNNNMRDAPNKNEKDKLIN